MNRVCLLVLLLAGCAPVGVVPTGANAYLVTKSGPGSSGGRLLSLAYKDAAAHCEKMGKQIETTNSTSRGSGFFRSGNAELHFRCVEK